MRQHPARTSGSRHVTTVMLALALVALVAMVVLDRLDLGSSPAVTATPAAAAAAGEGAAAAPATTLAAGDQAATPAVEDDSTPVDGGTCKLEVRSLQIGSTGDSVTCLQQALTAAGLYQGGIDGTYGPSVYNAVRVLQEQRHMYVDGVVGRETALSLGIWPDEQSNVVRTPPPPKGAKDAMGYPLSSVASTGTSAPPLPAGSGSGRRLVYDRAGQRVWAVAANGTIIRSWLVSGSQYNNELPGTHKVYSRSPVSTAWNGRAYLPKMVRWLKTDRGAIGFHAIPLHVSDRSPYQTEAELGTRLSGGCQRQANADAAFLWDFAQLGTPVVVL